jgi:hypothetical protein
MSDERWKRVSALFQAAQKCAPEERSLFVRRAAAGDSGLRREVESLLAQDLKSVTIDEQIAAAARSLLPDNRGVQPGSFIGPYRVDSLLGVGGPPFARVQAGSASYGGSCVPHWSFVR